MERYDTKSLGEVLHGVLQDTELSRNLDEARAVTAWPVVVGADIAARSPRPTVRGGIMTVRIYSAGLRQELSMMRSGLVRTINKVVGRDVITDIRFVS